MKDSEQTIGNLVDKSNTAFISYVDKRISCHESDVETARTSRHKSILV